MPVNLFTENVPDELADRLRQRAAANHRPLQEELMVIPEEAIAEKEILTPFQLLAEIRKIKLHTNPDSARWIRQGRDAR